MPDDRVKGEQPLDDPGPQPGGDPAAVSFEAELGLQRPDDCLNAPPQPVRERTGLLLVLAGRAGASQLPGVAGEEFLGFLPGQALIGDRSAASISGAAARSRVLYSLCRSSRGNRCPISFGAIRSQCRSSSNRSSTWATAMHASSASVTSGRLPGPRRVNPRLGMMRSVSST